MKWGALVKSARDIDSRDPLTDKPYTIKRLAEVMGHSESQQWSLEDGRIGLPSPDTMNGFAKHIGLPVATQLKTIGYEVETELAPKEEQLVRWYRNAPDDLKSAILLWARAASVRQDAEPLR